MHKQILKNLLAYHRDLHFEDFCKDLYPEFDISESRGYLHNKYRLFIRNFIFFLSDADECRLEKMSEIIFNRSNTNEH